MEQEDLAISPHMDFTGAISILIINFYQLQQKKREKDTKTERISNRRREKTTHGYSLYHLDITAIQRKDEG